MAHTPGPWGYHLIKKCWSIDCPYGSIGHIAQPASEPEGEANARLIAAAPDMLDLCKSILARLDMEYDEQIAKGIERPMFINAGYRDSLRNTIKSAEGR